MTRRRATRPVSLLAAATLAVLAGGCFMPGYSPGGSLASRDLYTYESTIDMPQNVALVDLRTGEQIWSVQVPIGQQLVVRFFDNHTEGTPENPALMRWQLMARGKRWGDLRSAMPVPNASERRLDVTLREFGEQGRTAGQP